MYFEVLLTNDERNAVLSALSAAIEGCYEAPAEDAAMVEDYKKALLDARAVMLEAVLG